MDCRQVDDIGATPATLAFAVDGDMSPPMEESAIGLPQGEPARAVSATLDVPPPDVSVEESQGAIPPTDSLQLASVDEDMSDEPQQSWSAGSATYATTEASAIPHAASNPPLEQLGSTDPESVVTPAIQRHVSPEALAEPASELNVPALPTTESHAESQSSTWLQDLTQPQRFPEACISSEKQNPPPKTPERQHRLSHLSVSSEALSHIEAQPFSSSLPPAPELQTAYTPPVLEDEHLYAPSSPLSSIGTVASLEDTPSSKITDFSPVSHKSTTGPVSDTKFDDYAIEYDYQGSDGRQFMRFKPTRSQWEDFPTVLQYARHMGAENDGCFKVVIPNDWYGSLPEKMAQKAKAHAYRIKLISRSGFWQVTSIPSEGTFSSPEPGPEGLESVEGALKRLKRLFYKNKGKQLPAVRYRADVEAWNSQQRQEAGVPDQSPIYPLKGDKLDHTKAIVPGIHTPYVYESASQFGATFQIHAEDYRLCSLNHLYRGRKVWIVVPSTAIGAAEKAFGRKNKCYQFMRHRAEFFFPEQLEKMGIPYRIVDQRPGETIVVLPDAYHEGFSTGYTIAEAKNYAEADWSFDSYQPCDASCNLPTAIGPTLMAPLKEGEERLNLCAPREEIIRALKRSQDALDAMETQNTKRVKTEL